MQLFRTVHTSRSLTYAVVVSVTMPLLLASCSGVAAAAPKITELHAAQDSDLLSGTTDQVYELTGFELTGLPLASQLGVAVPSAIDCAGFIVLSDGVITAAEFHLAAPSMQQARYTLTEPTVLRRAEAETGPVYAVGELALGAHEPRTATVKLTPGAATDQAVEFDLEFEVPADLGASAGLSQGEQITAKITLEPAQQH